MSGIQVRDLVKEWGPTRAVDKVSFDVPKGSLTVLLGPSGCGKSTILRMLAGLETATSGKVLIGGVDVTDKEPKERGVSMVFQSYALFPHLDVRENILFGLKVRRVPAAERDQRLMNAATMVGLDALLDRKPAQLSGGQRQRVALARTIVANQPVCLMDEPLSNLDAKLRAEMRDEIHSLQRKLGLTMVYVTHDQIEAMSMADQVVLLKEGRIEQIGDPASLYEKPRTIFAARFLGQPPMNVLEIAQIESDASMGDVLPRFPAGWSLGVRPEKVRLTDRGIAAEVVAIDYMGAETVIRLRHAGMDLMARVDGRAQVALGDTVHVRWEAADIHIFDDQGIRRSGEGAPTPKPA